MSIDTSDIRQKNHAGPGSWNSAGEPDIITYAVQGALAERVRRRFKVSETSDVFLKHSTFYGGYSEYTQENSTEFEVLAGDEKIVFDPRENYWELRDSSTSVYARFHAWLRATEDPVVLLSEWLSLAPTETTQDGKLTRHALVEGSVLMEQVRLKSYSSWSITEAYLELYRVEEETHASVYAIGGKPGDSFRQQYLALDLGIVETGSDVAAMAPALALLLTDSFMPGQSIR